MCTFCEQTCAVHGRCGRRESSSVRAAFVCPQVCRHHAAAVAQGHGHAQSFVCPYHSWTYGEACRQGTAWSWCDCCTKATALAVRAWDCSRYLLRQCQAVLAGLDGRLLQAVKVGGIRDFKAKDNGLVPMRVETWGPFIFVHPLAAPDRWVSLYCAQGMLTVFVSSDSSNQSFLWCSCEKEFVSCSSILTPLVPAQEQLQTQRGPCSCFDNGIFQRATVHLCTTSEKSLHPRLSPQDPHLPSHPPCVTPAVIQPQCTLSARN